VQGRTIFPGFIERSDELAAATLDGVLFLVIVIQVVFERTN
jgi:hypothetical protein